MKFVSDIKLKSYGFRYLFQCGLAGLSILAVLVAMNHAGHNKAIAASLGSSAFVVFASPNAYSARLRSIIGGNIVGIITGALLSLLLSVFIPSVYQGWTTPRIAAGAVAVSLSMFIMSITDTEHPPAAGLALGIVLGSWNWNNLLVIAAAVTFLGAVKKFFSSKIIDLY
jgi:CBS-domain-containing membrane protein